ncbi:MAG: DUF58 domain-containing protein [Candidatus Brocadiia bacterium]
MAPSTDPAARSADGALLGEDFLRKLDLLQIIFRRSVMGRREGDRPGRQRGGRIEFADYREYTPGDDLRYLDWNVYGRTDRLFIKEFTKDESVLVCPLVDASSSMGLGTPPKLAYARRLAAAFAYLALVARNEAQLAAFADGEVRWSPRYAGKPDLGAMASFLLPLRARGGTDLLGALRAFRERVGERALLVLVSDLWDEGEARRGLRLLASQRYDLAVLHVLSPQELHPPAVGAARLVDAETGQATDLVVDAAARRRYLDRLNAFCEQWRAFCQRHDARYLQVSTATPFEQGVLGLLRRGGLVR